jgi:hypothetical protein
MWPSKITALGASRQKPAIGGLSTRARDPGAHAFDTLEESNHIRTASVFFTRLDELTDTSDA